MTKIEKMISDVIRKHIVAIGFFAIVLLSLLMRIEMLDKVTADYSFFMSKWIEQLNQYKGLSGLGQNIGEYNVPYMLFLNVIGKTSYNDLHEIKILSIIFDYLGAFAALKIISLVTKTKFFSSTNLIACAVILLNPVFFLNSAYWAQCDFIYSALCLFSLYYMLKGNNNLCAVFFGLALALKLQAIFFFPVLVICYLVNRKMKIFHFLWIPAIFVVAALPAIIAGRGVVETLSIYVSQTSIYTKLTMACPNIFVFMSGEYELLNKVGIILALSVLGVGACAFIKRGEVSAKETVLLSAWSAFVCIYFLPAMHERYVFMACVFSLVWAFICHRDWWIALGINLVCFLSYTPYLFRNTVVDMKYLAIANLVFLAYMTYRLFSQKGREVFAANAPTK